MAKKPASGKSTGEKTKTSGETPITGIRIPLDTKAALESAAKEDGRTMSGLVLKILNDWLKDNGWK